VPAFPETYQSDLNNNYEKAKELALKLNSIFGQDNFYLELQMNGIEEQNIVNQQLIKLSRETEYPCCHQ